MNDDRSLQECEEEEVRVSHGSDWDFLPFPSFPRAHWVLQKAEMQSKQTVTVVTTDLGEAGVEREREVLLPGIRSGRERTPHPVSRK